MTDFHALRDVLPAHFGLNIVVDPRLPPGKFYIVSPEDAFEITMLVPLFGVSGHDLILGKRPSLYTRYCVGEREIARERRKRMRDRRGRYVPRRGPSWAEGQVDALREALGPFGTVGARKGTLREGRHL